MNKRHQFEKQPIAENQQRDSERRHWLYQWMAGYRRSAPGAVCADRR